MLVEGGKTDVCFRTYHLHLVSSYKLIVTLGILWKENFICFDHTVGLIDTVY